MKEIKDYLMKRKTICIIETCIVVMIAIMGYFYYQNGQKQKTLESMKITFNEITEIEYGTKNYDVEKELVKEVKNAKIKDIPEIDTMKVGEQTLNFVIVKDNLEKEVEYKINIKDTKIPEIKLKNNSIEITVNDKFDIKSNIESVKDPIDGNISFNKDALEINKKATDEYNKLKKEDINKDTKVADRLISDFLLEDKEEKNLYLKDCYYIESDVDTTKTGKYSVKIIAVDKNGLKSISEYKVTVKEKEVEKPQSNETINVKSSYKSHSNSKGNNSGNVTRGSKQDIVNTALAQVGKKYAKNTAGPNSFDCSGLIYYAYTQNGWSIPRRISSGGTRLSSYSELQPGDIIYLPEANHVILYIGNDQIVEAKNENTGVAVSSMRGLISFGYELQFIRY